MTSMRSVPFSIPLEVLIWLLLLSWMEWLSIRNGLAKIHLSIIIPCMETLKLARRLRWGLSSRRIWSPLIAHLRLIYLKSLIWTVSMESITILGSSIERMGFSIKIWDSSLLISQRTLKQDSVECSSNRKIRFSTYFRVKRWTDLTPLKMWHHSNKRTLSNLTLTLECSSLLTWCLSLAQPFQNIQQRVNTFVITSIPTTPRLVGRLLRPSRLHFIVRNKKLRKKAKGRNNRWERMQHRLQQRQRLMERKRYVKSLRHLHLQRQWCKWQLRKQLGCI